MNTQVVPNLIFDGLTQQILNINNSQSAWIDQNNLKITYNLQNLVVEDFDIDINISNIKDEANNSVSNIILEDIFGVDTKRPIISNLNASSNIVADSNVGIGAFNIVIDYDEIMDTIQKPIVELFYNGVLNNSVNYNVFGSNWLNNQAFEAKFNVVDLNTEQENLELRVNFARDISGNAQNIFNQSNWISIDTKNPSTISLTANTYEITSTNTQLIVTAVFDEEMETSTNFDLNFIDAVGIESCLEKNTSESQWLNSFVYQIVYDVVLPFQQESIDVQTINARDLALNEVIQELYGSFFSLKINPLSVVNASNDLVTIYPNPVSKNEPIIISTTNFDLAIYIFNSLGQKVNLENDVNKTQNGYSINTRNLPSGFYNLVLKSQALTKNHKVLIID
jgi:hypothetical protein